MLRLSEVSVAYGRARAVERASLELRDGEVVALVGANGAGKSSTLKCIAGVAPLTSGQITLDGVRVERMPSHQRPAAGIALSPEGRQVFPGMSVLENLELGAGHAPPGPFKTRLRQVYELFPRLEERMRQEAGTLSGGEQQMLAIGRALMSGPKVLMLDEPTLGLAPVIVEQLVGAIGVLKARGIAILLSEQNVEMALQVSDRAYVIESGRIIREGRSAELAGDPAIQSAYLGL